VVRNRAKRLIREVFRQLPDLLPDDVDMVVIVRSMWTGATMADVKTEWLGVASVLARQAAAVRKRRETAT
jgi:ribonuclease P protein component